MDYLKRKNITCIKLHIINLLIVAITYIVSYLVFSMEPIREGIHLIILLLVLTILAIMHCKIKEENKYFKYNINNIIFIYISFAYTCGVYIGIFCYTSKKVNLL